MFRGGRQPRAGASRVARCRSDVQEADVGGVALDEGAPLLDVVAHEDREGLVGVCGLVGAGAVFALEKYSERGDNKAMKIVLFVCIGAIIAATATGIMDAVVA